MKTRLLSLPLIYAMTAPLLVITCAGTLLVTGLSLRAGSHTAETVVSELGAQMVRDVEGSLRDVFAVPFHLNASNDGALRSGALDMSNASERDRFFVGQLKAFPQVSYSYYGREDGSFYGARRNEAGSIEAIHNDAGTAGNSLYFSIDEYGNPSSLAATIPHFDCRTRPWYVAGIASGGPVYSEIYRHFVYRDLAITAALGVPDGRGAYEGVLGVDFRLDRINTFLKELAPVPGSAIAVVERKTGYLIGNSLNLPNFREADDGRLIRLSAGDLGTPALPGDTLADLGGGGAQLSDFTFDAGSSKMRLASGRIEDYGFDWLVFVSLPYKAFTSAIDAGARTTLLLGVLITLSLLILIPLLTRLLLRPIAQVVSAADRISSGEWDFIAPYGTYRETALLADSFNSMAARLRASIGGLEDAVAARTRELAAKNRELEESNTTKDTFFAILAHDLRGSIGTIAELLSGIDDGSLCFCEDELKAINHEMATASRNVAQLLEDLLTWAASQRGDISYEAESCDLDGLIAEAIGVASPVATGKGIRIVYEKQVALVRCDKNMIRTVLRNLLSNAIKFTPPKGSVSVSVAAASTSVRVSVADTGMGMDAAMVQSLYDPGRATRRLGTEGERGSGLGLRLCHNFLSRHGGRMEIESELGVGSVFSFTLPLG